MFTYKELSLSAIVSGTHLSGVLSAGVNSGMNPQVEASPNIGSALSPLGIGSVLTLLNVEIS